jgi:hypothetical protein
MWFGKQSKEIRKGIGEECDAFLRGEYVEYASAMGWDTPVWAWMNAIAHADENRLAQIAVFGFRQTLPWRADGSGTAPPAASRLLSLTKSAAQAAG